MPQVVLTNAQEVPSTGDRGPGTVSCSEAEAEMYVAAGYGTRVAGT